jgi:hypothetical protein
MMSPPRNSIRDGLAKRESMSKDVPSFTLGGMGREGLVKPALGWEEGA